MSTDLERARTVAALAELSEALEMMTVSGQTVGHTAGLACAARRLLRRIAPEDYSFRVMSYSEVRRCASDLDLAMTAKVLTQAAERVLQMDVGAAIELDNTVCRLLDRIKWIEWNEEAEIEYNKEAAKQVARVRKDMEKFDGIMEQLEAEDDED